MENKPEILTPKNKSRSLGLKRSIQRNNVPKTPLSDGKINYKSLQDDIGIAPSPSTPCLTHKLVGRTSAYTTNCLPYRLTLGSQVREKYKKKKLEFAASIHEPEADCLQQDASSPCKTEKELPAELLQQIISKEIVLKKHQKHKEKVQELRTVINTWKDAFKASLEELSSKIEPPMEAEHLIARLGIPPELIDYA